MLALADVQAAVRRAVTTGESSAIAMLLSGGRDPRQRLAIHRHHYVTSLMAALLARFPATVWLLGSEFVTSAARAYVEAQPPTHPCIAEYGEEFPGFIATQPGASNFLYVEPFARLEWHLGRLALAVEHPAISDLAAICGHDVEDVALDVQPSVEYIHLAWPVDTLISVFLTDIEPDQFELRPEDVWLEVRGVRGELRMTRLSASEFTFRAAVADGVRLGDAVLRAVVRDAAFDVSAAFTSLLDDGLVTGAKNQQETST